MMNVQELPDDPATLKRIIADIQADAAAEREAIVARIKAEAQQQIDALEQRHQAELKAAMDALFRRYYGPRSERFDPRQLLLFGELVDELPLNEQDINEEAGEELVTRRIKKRHKHGRSPLPEHLERIEIEHDLEESEKACPGCGEERQRIGQEISEQLEYFPASFKVLQHIRHKYGCPCCDEAGHNPNITTAPKPPQPIEKGLPGPSLLAHVIVSKLADHLPLYRLEQIFTRQKVDVARSTMSAWMRAAGELVTPLVDTMIERVRQSQVIHTDDTPVPIQSPGQKQCRKGRIWCYLGDRDRPYDIYDYTPNRKRAGPAEWLKTFSGYLQADAYGGYDGIYAHGSIIEVACWAHARRKFYDAQDSDKRRSAQMLALIGKLYAVERELKALDEAEQHKHKTAAEKDAIRLATRQERSVPALDEIKAWLDKEAEIVLPKSPMGQAIQYAQNQWPALCEYTSQGFLNIDNNAAERALKPVAIGRKNWLFAGTDEAAASHAKLWTLLTSAKRHGLDPQQYLTSVLAKLPFIKDGEAEKLGQFLPDVWKREDAGESVPR